MIGDRGDSSSDLSLDDPSVSKCELEAIDPVQYSHKQKYDRYLQKNGNAHRSSNSATDHDPSTTYGKHKIDAGSFWTEVRLFLEQAGVSCLMSLGFILSPMLTASYIGRSFPTVYLSAFTLANLTGNVCTFSLMTGLFSASDTLSPQAFGRGDYPEVGRIAIRGFVASFVLLFPINTILFFYLDVILVALGQDEEASAYASQWYSIYAFNLPFSVLYSCLWKFLTSQHIMKPLIVVSIFCTGFVLPLSLEVSIKAMGFLGSAVAFVMVQVAQSLLLVIYLWWKHPHHVGTWPGLSPDSIRSALEWHQMKEFLHLGIGGIVAQCEWIFWEGIGLVVGKLGVVALSVHTIPNQTTMSFSMAPYSIGVALAIRMGVSLSLSVRRTQAIVLLVCGGTAILFGLVSVLLYVSFDMIVDFFTTDDAVKALADTIWLEVAFFNFNVTIFAVFAGVATGLGKQWPLGVINFVFLWLFGMPIIYYTAIVLDRGLGAVWFWMNVLYLGMNITLIILFISTDWYQIQQQILLKNEDTSTCDDDQEACIMVANETTRLL